MIVYSETKGQFNTDVLSNIISDKILKKMRDNHVSGGADDEFNSWQNSLHFIRNVIDDNDISNDVNISIEYQIPRTSKRVDFIIAGSDGNRDSVVVVELKQWTKAEKIANEMQHSVRTFTGGANRMVSHPSYQAYSYSVFIRNFSEQVQDNNINIVPCAYLHNYQEQYLDQLNDPIYQTWIDEAPFFIKTDTLKIRDFIKKYITKKSSNGDLLYLIDNGRIRPSKALQDSIVSLMKGNKEFLLLDDQVVAYDACKKTMDQCLKDLRKRTIIIQGGPGTGKSVLAINLLKDFVSKSLNASYVTKNSAPRNAFTKLLSKSDLKKEIDIKGLFRSPYRLCEAPNNYYDCLIVDEAHRLVKKMYGDFKGENQVKECINSSLLTIFMLDEDQAITTKDIGSIDEIRKWGIELNSRVIINEDTVLKSQFRCNGSDAYIQLLNNILGIGEYIEVDLNELNYNIKVFDDPNILRDELREINEINNKARMVAGYCYDWDVKNGRGEYDIYLKNDFKAKWNLEGDNIWAINPGSFEEVGCIHTAQGLEFDYVGVLIGKDLRWGVENNIIITDANMISKDDKSSGIRGSNKEIAKTLIINTYKTLLTRGQKGCFIYCEDDELYKRFKEVLQYI